MKHVLRIAKAIAATFVLIAALVTAVDVGSPAAASTLAIRPHGGAEQIWSTGLPNNTTVYLTQASRTLRSQKSSYLGAILFRNVPPGTGYRLRIGSTFSPYITVHSTASAPWDPGTYHQSVPDTGYGYLTTRDGTKLAYMVSLPTRPATLGVGLPSAIASALQGPAYAAPYPTLIEYSGYGTADPKGPEHGMAALANLMGFAVVDVQMRGSGCSGGAFDFFERMQELDAYDAIETVARQPWVKGHKVGMLGISYGGISQLFAAMTQPPHLAAITPLSVMDSIATTLFPGGSMNDGFALAWAKDRVHDALPSGPGAGQPYAAARIAAGDVTCAYNQKMHSQAINLLAKIRANSHYNAKVIDPLDTIAFVNRIKVPVFMACAWQDEETGGHCPDLVRHFTGTSKKWFTFNNGSHIDAVDPTTLNRMFDFLEIYVAGESPLVKAPLLRLAAPVLYQSALGTPFTNPITLPVDPIQLQPTLAGAQAAFDATPQVTVDYDNGAGGGLLAQPGDPYSAFSRTYSTFPAPGTTAAKWFLAPGGQLRTTQPTTSESDRFYANPHATPLVTYPNNGGTGQNTGGLWGNAAQWQYDWGQVPAGNSVSYVTTPLTHDTTVLGGGAVYVWVRSSTPDADLQATITEIRPDGQETFVQNGWQRLSERKLAGATNSLLKQPSTLLEPFPTMTAADAATMPAGKFTRVAIPLYYEGHVYRAGSRIRISIAGMNGTQPVWDFTEALPATGSSRIEIGVGAQFGSSLILPVVPDPAAPTRLPACPSLRNEPCRPYEPTPNASTRVVGLAPKVW